jgi:hypothetical protein
MKNQNTIYPSAKIVALCAVDLERVCWAAIGLTVTCVTKKEPTGFEPGPCCERRLGLL